jgi:hypothetical protein
MLVLAGCGAVTVTATACETTEQESAKLAREDHQPASGPAALKLGARNRSVRVSDLTLLRRSGRTAVAVKLTGTSTSTQIDVPLLLTVTGAGGKTLYSNDAGGLEPSLQRIGVLAPGRGAWWVDDQILTSKTPLAAHVRVGTGTTARTGSVPTLTTSRVHLSSTTGATVLQGGLVNHSAVTENRVAVFAVAVRDGKVTAAGRAVVETLPGRSATPVPFEIFLVGSAAGATLELTVAPTVA